MTLVAEKAARATRLRASKAFKEFWQDTLEPLNAVCVNPASKPDEIVEAHAMIRALHKIEASMRKAEFAGKLEDKRAKKGQHRATD